MHTLIDINGRDTARALVAPGQCELTLACPSGFTGASYYPAESFNLSGIETIRELHQLLGQMIEAYAEQPLGGEA